MSIKRILPAAVCIAYFLPLSSRAAHGCRQAVLQHERKNIATIQTLERAWSVAFLRGDIGFERCLLTPDFTEIGRDGGVKVLADELGFAAQNAGKNLPMPEIPAVTVMIHGDVAVAYLAVQRIKDGKALKVYNADYYVWEEGGWHAFFSQQTAFSG